MAVKNRTSHHNLKRNELFSAPRQIATALCSDSPVLYFFVLYSNVISVLEVSPNDTKPYFEGQKILASLTRAKL